MLHKLLNPLKQTLFGCDFCNNSFKKYDLLQQGKQVPTELFNAELHTHAVNLSKMEV